MIDYGIDPGVRALGWARAVGGTIAAAGVVSTKDRAADLSDLARSFAGALAAGGPYGAGCDGTTHLESMVTDGRQVPPQDLIDVQTVGCLTAAYLCGPECGKVRLWTPNAWKSNIPKSVHHSRIVACLRPTEIVVVHAAAASAGKSHGKEVLDAVGLLLVGLGRMDRAGRRLK